MLLEIMYLVVRGVGVKDVARVRGKKARVGGDESGGMIGDGEDEELKALLEREKREKKLGRRGAPTRHSRFGTTITLKTVRHPLPYLLLYFDLLECRIRNTMSCIDKKPSQPTLLR